MDMIKIRMGQILLILSAASILAVVACGGGDGDGSATSPTATVTTGETTGAQPAATPTPTPGKTVEEGPSATGKKFTAFIVLEKGGEIPIELLVDNAPSTVSNFITLAREGYYDGVAFELVSFLSVAQTADPEGFEPGGGLKWESELTDLGHAPAIVSMDNSRAEVNRGQIFISFVQTKYLDTTHTIFGRVIGDGIDVARTLTIRDPVSALTEPETIKTIRIEEGQ